LFSRTEVAEFVNETFEPVWVSVRPAPAVTIDFGNGHTLTRTLQGNVATYVCDSDGTVYDVLPGIYTPGPYREQLVLLAELVKQLAPVPAVESAARLKAYHTQRAAALRGPVTPQAAAVALTGGGGKGGFGGGGGSQAGGGGFGGGGQGGFGGRPAPFGGGIEGPLEAVIAGRPFVPPTPPGGDLAARPDLIFDTKVNETIRRKMVHDRLAALGRVRPDDIKGWLFREVLKADLDDPMLGLGPVLNANYPFAEEDRTAAK
jgi:hypothetical protein